MPANLSSIESKKPSNNSPNHQRPFSLRVPRLISRVAAVAENAILRQQLVVLKRQVKRPKFTNGDRLRMVLLSRVTQFWNKALHLVQPETVLRWHRDLFRRHWKRKSKPKNLKPRIPQETIDLIKEMAQKNWFWGAEKIQGELLKLGINKKFLAVAKSSGIEELKTPFQAPKANALCERLIGTITTVGRLVLAACFGQKWQ